MPQWRKKIANKIFGNKNYTLLNYGNITESYNDYILVMLVFRTDGAV